MRVAVTIFFLLFLFQTGLSQESDSLDIMIGQMIMIGIGDYSNTYQEPEVFEHIAAGKVGGVVLYEKNLYFERPKPALADMVESLQQNAAIPLFVSIDEEGGYVTRMKTRYGFPKNVSQQYLGELDNPDSTLFYAGQTASLLASFGINMNYAPVVDVNLNPTNPVIGKIERSYSSSHLEVIEHAAKSMLAHHEQGVVPVIKHFPGHGSSQRDTHLGVTDVSNTWQVEELYPYASLLDSGMVSAIMTAHIVNRTLDNQKLPATLSKTIISGVLRGFLEYDGVIISDDMQMGAIRNEYGIREAINKSINAGVDILMFANNVNEYDRVSAAQIHAIIKDLIFEKEISESRIRTSFKRIMKLKQGIGLTEEGYFRTLKSKLNAYR